MRVLLVRPRAQAKGTARRLSLRGHSALVAPILDVEATPAAPPDGRPDAIVVTSANAAPALAAEAEWRDVPVFAVGEKSAEAVVAAGFARVAASDGAADRLAAAVKEVCPAGARLLVVAGRDRKPEPERSLRAAGFEVAVWEAYAAGAADALPAKITNALKAGEIEAALHYSRRSAETLVDLAGEAGVRDVLRSVVHVCMSDDVREGLAKLGPGLATAVANAPTENALLLALDAATKDAAPDDPPGRNEGSSDAPPVVPKLESGGPDREGSDQTPAGTDLERLPVSDYQRRNDDVPEQARPLSGHDGKGGTNPEANDFRDAKAEESRMSEPRPEDPLRREPPTIDLAAASTSSAPPPRPPEGTSDQPDPGTAIEPVAATGLGPHPFSADAGPVTEPAAEAASPDRTDAGIASGTEREDGPPGEAGARGGSVPPVSGRGDQDGGPAPVRSGGFGKLLAAGLLGGIIGAGLLFGIDQVWSPGADGEAERISRLEQRVAALPSGNAGSDRLTALESGVRNAQDTANAARAAAQQAANRPPPAGGGGSASPEALQSLTGRVDQIGQKADANAKALGDLSGKVDGAATQSAVSAAVAPLSKDLKSVSDTQAELRKGQNDAQSKLGELQSKSGELQTKTGDLQSRLGEVQTKVGSIDGRLQKATDELGKISPSSVQAALRIVVAGRLEDALRSGSTLKPALDAMQRVGGTDEGALAALRPYADTQPASAATLAAEFKPLADKMLEQPQSSDASFGDRLRRVAEKIVTVRVVGDAGTGSGLPSLVARIQAALDRGALADAASLWDQLPDRAKSVSTGWAQRLKGRVAAETAADRIASNAMASIDAAAPKAAPK